MTGERVSKRATIGLALLLTTGCDSLATGETSATAYPEYELSVDCGEDASATARRVILVHGVQILRLHVTGPDYNQQSRVQIFPADSDVHITGPQGEDPRHTVTAHDLATGKPVTTDLVHGSLVAQQHDGLPPEVSASSEVSILPSSEPKQQWLSFILSCAQGGTSPSPQPGQ